METVIYSIEYNKYIATHTTTFKNTGQTKVMESSRKSCRINTIKSEKGKGE